MGTTLARAALFLLAVAATAIAAESRDAWVLLGDKGNTMSGSIKEEALSREIEELALDPVANARQIEAIAHKQEQLAKRIEAKAAAMEAQLLALADEAIAAGLATSPK
jgi:hypothetical protein